MGHRLALSLGVPHTVDIFDLPIEFFPVLFVPMWVLVCLLVARIGGWSLLAEIYRSSEPFEGSKWRFQSAQMRWWMNYNNCLTVGTNSRGLYLATFLLFRPGHPPLFVPWTDVSVNRRPGILFTYWDFRFRRAPDLSFRINDRLKERIAGAAGRSWPGLDTTESTAT